MENLNYRQMKEQSEEQRAERIAAYRKEQDERRAKRRAEYKEEARQRARCYDQQAAITTTSIDLLKKHAGKQWTKRIADDLQTYFPGTRVYKDERFDWHYISVSLRDMFPHLNYEATLLMMEVKLTNDCRLDYDKTAAELTKKVEVLKHNADSYRRAAKDLDKCIKAAEKLREQIRKYGDDFDQFARMFDECRITNTYLLNC